MKHNSFIIAAFCLFVFSCDEDSLIVQSVDCNGNLSGNAQEDNCGVCDEDSSNDCSQDCLGVWGGTSISDIDNNCYSVLEIGNQSWLSENLKVTHYNNGDAINGTILSDQEWGEIYGVWPISDLDYANLPGAYCAFDNNQAFIEDVGLLYNGHAVNDNRGLCPEGFHVPSTEEWNDLETYLEQQSSEPINYQLASSLYCQNASNLTNFSGGYGGNRDYNNGQFFSFEIKSMYWTSSMDGNSLIRQIHRKISCSDLDYLWSGVASYNGFAESVRCIKD